MWAAHARTLAATQILDLTEHLEWADGACRRVQAAPSAEGRLVGANNASEDRNT
jgi:hypothetical protein